MPPKTRPSAWTSSTIGASGGGGGPGCGFGDGDGLGGGGGGGDGLGGGWGALLPPTHAVQLPVGRLHFGLPFPTQQHVPPQFGLKFHVLHPAPWLQQACSHRADVVAFFTPSRFGHCNPEMLNGKGLHAAPPASASSSPVASAPLTTAAVSSSTTATAVLHGMFICLRGYRTERLRTLGSGWLIFLFQG